MMNIKRLQGSNVPEKDLVKRWKILRGDTVAITSGPSSGKTGKVVKVIRRLNKLVVEGANITKRHVKKGTVDPNAKQQHKYTFAPSPVHYSRVSLIDPTDNKPCRIQWKFTEDGTRVRVSKRTGTIIPKPKHEFKLKELHQSIGAKDTEPEIVGMATFDPATLNPLLKASIKYREWSLSSAGQEGKGDPL